MLSYTHILRAIQTVICLEICKLSHTKPHTHDKTCGLFCQTKRLDHTNWLFPPKKKRHGTLRLSLYTYSRVKFPDGSRFRTFYPSDPGTLVSLRKIPDLGAKFHPHPKKLLFVCLGEGNQVKHNTVAAVAQD
mmetsp:Transcript_1354/g.1420  ORF Transcript_1354/g.1420 Transcript_1354/m.1420 type:complete len:132 (-) Transcript_1354:521-916(-)